MMFIAIETGIGKPPTSLYSNGRKAGQRENLWLEYWLGCSCRITSISCFKRRKKGESLSLCSVFVAVCPSVLILNMRARAVFFKELIRQKESMMIHI